MTGSVTVGKQTAGRSSDWLPEQGPTTPTPGQRSGSLLQRPNDSNACKTPLGQLALVCSGGISESCAAAWTSSGKSDSS